MALYAGAGCQPLAIPDCPRSADGTSLQARVLVLDDGERRLALVSLTVIALLRADALRVRAAVAAAAGVPPEAVLVACTHLHSGPATMLPDPSARRALVDRLCAAAAAAARQAASLRPARVGYAVDDLPGVSRVRRIQRYDGSVITLRRAWPQYWGWASDPQTRGPEEPLDDLLTVLRVDTAAGEPLAAVVHFTCHPIPDYFGYAADLVERALAGPPCLVFNGCQGTVDAPFEVPLRGRLQAEQLPILGSILGYRCLELLQRAQTRDGGPVAVAGCPVFLPADAVFLSEPGDKAALYASALAAGGFDTEVQCLRIGDLAFAGLPGEAAVGFGATVEQLSPFGLARAIGLANDEVGYLLPAESRARGGYEADPRLWGLADGQALPILREAVARCFAGLEAVRARPA